MQFAKKNPFPLRERVLLCGYKTATRVFLAGVLNPKPGVWCEQKNAYVSNNVDGWHASSNLRAQRCEASP